MVALSQPEREALLKLLILGMYADHHLSLVEEERLRSILENLGWESKQQSRDTFLLGAIADMRRLADQDGAVDTLVKDLAKVFTSEAARQGALAMLREFLKEDGEAETEKRYLAKLAFAFRA